MTTLLQTPYRSPLIIVETIKDIIEDKIVCVLGCASGDLLIEMKKYAKEVMGMENSYPSVMEARERGLDVIWGDIFKNKIPAAEVYYVWINEHLTGQVVSFIKKGIIILASDPSIAEDIEIARLDLEGQWRETYYNEGDKSRQQGIFKVFITEMK